MILYTTFFPGKFIYFLVYQTRPGVSPLDQVQVRLRPGAAPNRVPQVQLREKTK